MSDSSETKPAAEEKKKDKKKRLNANDVYLVTGALTFFVLTQVAMTGFPEPADSMSALCWVFAQVPGLVAMANYVVTVRQRKSDGSGQEDESKHRPTSAEAFAAALLLTTVFLVVARTPSRSGNEIQGWVYAGYGAYISTLWFMLVRLNANALSPRFLINSALKVSIAVFIGYIVSKSNFLNSEGASVATLYFAVGLFHSWAMRALKKTAMATFGITSAWPADASLASIDGLDDDAADVLQEIGITSAQHLATMHIPEVCGRTLYPRDRVLDWIDQAILAKHTNGRLPELRAIGIHSAHALVTIGDYYYATCEPHPVKLELHQAAGERLTEAAERLGMSRGSLLLIVECIRKDATYDEIREIRCGEQTDAQVATAHASEGQGGPMIHLRAQEGRSPRRPLTGGSPIQRPQPRWPG
jgi:hypothetical protein